MLIEGLYKKHGENRDSSIKVLRLPVAEWDTLKGPGKQE